MASGFPICGKGPPRQSRDCRATLLVGRSSLRGRELAVRLAIGADPRRLVRAALAESLCFAGLVLSLTDSAIAMPLLTRMLYGVQPLDAVTFASVGLVILIAALLSCYLPARRATKVEPLELLRQG